MIAYGYSKQPIPGHENAVIIVGKQHNYLVEAADEEPQKDIFKKVVTQLDLKYLTISSQYQNSREFDIYHRNQNEPLQEQLKIQFNKPGSLITTEQQTLKQLGFECHATTPQSSYCYRMVHYTISPIPKTNNDADLKHLFRQPIKFTVPAPSYASNLAKDPYDLLLPRNFLIVEGKSEYEFITRIIKKYYSNEYMTPGLRSTLVRIVKKANPSSKEGD